MDHSNDPRSLVRSLFGFLARKPAETSGRPASSRSRARNAWVRADSFLLDEDDEFSNISPEQVKRSLPAFEDLVEDDSDQEQNSTSHHGPFPKLQKVHNIMKRQNGDAHPDSSSKIRVTKRKRESEAGIEEFSRLNGEMKKRRVLPREEPNVDDDIEDPKADLAMLMRKHLVSLDNALRQHWICVCQKCSGLSVRLSLPRRKKGNKVETEFEVFFGVRNNLLATTLQEAKITVKDLQDNRPRSASEPVHSVFTELVHICQSITESLDQQNCLHFALEDGRFKRLRPQPKTFGDGQVPPQVSLSALFKRQQQLTGRSSALPLKGKRILAVTLATALLPFLETPWVKPSFDHSKIQFFQPLQDGELPNITKPFLSMEHIPIVTASKIDARNGQVDPDNFRQRIHPNASVLALGILLCELHFCTPLELLRKDTKIAQNVNTDWYTSLEILQDLKEEVGEDYYLATKACLNFEYLPPGEPADFESATVQRRFYQNVVKRLEAELFGLWRLQVEDLASFDARENELCWGVIGREVIHQQTSKAESSATSNGGRASTRRAASDTRSSTYPSHNSNPLPQIPNHLSRGFQTRPHLAEASATSLHFFDASHQTISGQDTGLSDQWIYRLQSSLSHHVDPFDAMKAKDIAFEPVRIAILDSGFDSGNPLLRTDDGQLDPRIKAARSFVHNTEPLVDFQDEIGHGTHTLGLLLNVATCAEIYIAKVAGRETLGDDSYNDIAKAIDYAVTKWNVDIISMSFGIREYNLPMITAVQNASHNKTLMFAAASNDGANLGRAFPAKYPLVFCIHSTDGNGNPSGFNPTADDHDVNFSLLGENVNSHWPAGKSGHDGHSRAMSGTSVATPIAAGLAASIMSFVRQQDQKQGMAGGTELLSPWLKNADSMDLVLKSMVKQRRGVGYDYITSDELLDPHSSRAYVYEKIKDIKRKMYK